MSIKDSVPETHHDFLDAAGVTALVTIDANGRPQTTAVWYLVDEDGELKTSVDGSRQKFKNASANPAISFFFVDPANPFRTLEIRGDAEIEKDGEGFPFLERLVKKYGATSDQILATGRDRHVLTIKPWRVVANG